MNARADWLGGRCTYCGRQLRRRAKLGFAGTAKCDRWYCRVNRVKMQPFFRWYDLWIGMYYDRKGRSLYLCPLPMLGIKVTW